MGAAKGHAGCDPVGRIRPLARTRRAGIPPGGLIYQIFPDRFRNGDPRLTPRPGSWKWRGHPIEVSSEASRLTRYPQDQYTFFGGDLPGVEASLDDLAQLGVETVYLNPIFAARSTHRYDATDFLSIDPALGTRKHFESLVAALKARGMRLVLDGVFNHTSDDHPWHRTIVSRRRHYLMRDRFHPMTWMGHGVLPKLDTQRADVVRDILAVIDAWPEVDGWRLDAAHLLPRDLLARIRARAGGRTIVVEDWTYARHYFDARLADGVTNFLFRDSMVSFFREDLSPETLIERWRLWIEGYPPHALAHVWNFLDNHDTGRFTSIVGRERLARALALLFTLPGSPLIFQGTEVGMHGRNEGEARAPMILDRRKWDRPLREGVCRLAALRRTTPALRRGRWRALAADNRSRGLAFERVHRDGRAIMALSDGYHPFRVAIGRRTATIAPGQWAVWTEGVGGGLIRALASEELC